MKLQVNKISAFYSIKVASGLDWGVMLLSQEYEIKQRRVRLSLGWVTAQGLVPC